MPTPFYHLSVAIDLLEHSQISLPVRRVLQQNRDAFLLGNTAPDVQTISQQERTETHFFDLPIYPGSRPAWKRLLNAFPALARPENLPEAQAAFLAGYVCHLQADWFWVLEIFLPVFGPLRTWQSFSQRLYLHNVLRAYLDQQILPGLPADMSLDLERARPSGWLPFVQDMYLEQWRDLLAEQLRPGAVVQTVEVFAARQGIPAENFYRLLESEDRLEQEIFTRLPRKALNNYRSRLLAKNSQFLQDYLNQNQRLSL